MKKVLNRILAGIIFAAMIFMPILATAEADGGNKSESTFSVGDTVLFGKYTFDSSAKNDSDAIQWVILDMDGNNALVISKRPLLVRNYLGYSDYIISWEMSYLRDYLNDKFITASFSDEEQKHIMTTLCIANDGDYLCEQFGDTEDKVFLLSVAQCQQYSLPEEDVTIMTRTMWNDHPLMENGVGYYNPNYGGYVAPSMWIENISSIGKEVY